MKFKIFLLLIILTLTVTNSFAAAGDLDPTFNGNGKLLTAQAVGGAVPNDVMLVQPDGKILTAVNNTSPQVRVLRFNPNGSFDTTFGTGGTQAVPQNQLSTVYSMTLQADGKILLSGQDGMNRCGTARLKANGATDTTFNANAAPANAPGTVSTLVVGPYCSAQAVKVQPDGKIVVGGYSNDTDQFGFSVTAIVAIRYNADGTLDSTFGTGGKAATAAENHHYSGGIRLLLQPDGKIVESVTRLYADVTQDGDVSLLRFNANGSLDTTFGSGGFAIATTAAREAISGAALLPDGKIVVSAYRADGTVLVRFDPSGALDTSFGSAGFAVNNDGATVDSAGTGALLVQPDGKILIGGSKVVADVTAFAVTRYNADGTLDSAFSRKPGKAFYQADSSPLWGSGGTSVAAFENRSAKIQSMSFDAVGRVIVAGPAQSTTATPPSPTYLALARFQSDASPYASVYGTIRTDGGMPIKNITVVLNNPDLVQPRYALTNQLGNYFFIDLPVTENYTISLSSKRFFFGVDQQNVMLLHDTENLNFTALP